LKIKYKYKEILISKSFLLYFQKKKKKKKKINNYYNNNIINIRIHLPAMFIGMQHLQISNNQLAEGFLTVAYGICDSDPILLNELGVLYYNKKEYIYI